MRNYPRFNFPAFDAQAAELAARGFEVVNPAELDRQTGFNPYSLSLDYDWSQLPPGMALEDVITRDVAALRQCSAYWTLDGWEKSVGATAEKALLDWQNAVWLNSPELESVFPVLAEAIQHLEKDMAASPEPSKPVKAYDLRLPGLGGAPTRISTLPEDPAERKKFPVASGFLDYFPDAVAAVANISWHGNNQHNPGQPLFWNRLKSGDEADAMMRHFLSRGTLDTDGVPHSAKLAWRALALLQKELEAGQKSTV